MKTITWAQFVEYVKGEYTILLDFVHITNISHIVSEENERFIIFFEYDGEEYNYEIMCKDNETILIKEQGLSVICQDVQGMKEESYMQFLKPIAF